VDDFTAGRLQARADAEHERQSVCTDCRRPGEPYDNNGVHFDGLLAYKGDRVCSPCASARMDVEGVDILVQDDRPGRMPYVHNTVRDADKIEIWIPRELRGIDGRDRVAKRRKRTR
jgi:hypothetical protein